MSDCDLNKMAGIEEVETRQQPSPPSPISSRSDDLISRVDIAEVTDFGDYQSLSTSALLSRCKHKILKPYLGLLAVMGLRSFGTERPNLSEVVKFFNYLHLFQVVLFTILGYVLQYKSGFRRDLGFCGQYTEFSGSDVFGFIIPSLLHFSAYMYVLYLFRFKETELLENLMERTFLLSAHRTVKPGKAHLVRSLWSYISASILWVVVLISLEVFLLLNGKNHYQWGYSKEHKLAFEVVLSLTTLWQDMVQATVITSYCLQVQLLSSSLHFLRAKLLQHTIQPLSWIREINECQNFLSYLNHEFSPGVCLFIFLDASWAVSGLVWFLKNKEEDDVTRTTVIVGVALWSLAALVPFVMAARLTSSCASLRRLGHEVRIRPFVYQDTPGEDLDTILLYTSTLKMKSKLFAVPVSPTYLFFCISFLTFSVLVIGQCQLL